MKNAFVLGFVALAFSLTVAACGEKKTETTDSTSVDSTTITTDSTVVDTAATDSLKMQADTAAKM